MEPFPIGAIESHSTEAAQRNLLVALAAVLGDSCSVPGSVLISALIC
jgi:hypothetical protein